MILLSWLSVSSSLPNAKFLQDRCHIMFPTSVSLPLQKPCQRWYSSRCLFEKTMSVHNWEGRRTGGRKVTGVMWREYYIGAWLGRKVKRVSLSRYYQLLSNTPSCRKLKTYCSWILQILPTHNHSPNPIFLYVQCVPFPAFLSHFNYHDPYSGIHFLIAEPWQALQIAPPCPRLL